MISGRRGHYKLFQRISRVILFLIDSMGGDSLGALLRGSLAPLPCLRPILATSYPHHQLCSSPSGFQISYNSSRFSS